MSAQDLLMTLSSYQAILDVLRSPQPYKMEDAARAGDLSRNLTFKAFKHCVCNE